MYNNIIMKNKLIRSVAEFMVEFGAWVTKIGGDNMLYRGLADESQEAEASLHRRLRGKSKSAPKEEFIRASEELVRQAKLRGYARDPAGELKDLQLMGRLQHYGAATCLIDFTKNPQVALWFACLPSKQKGGGADGKIIAVNISKSSKYKTVQSKNLDDSLRKLMKAKHLWKWKPESLDNRDITQHSEFIFGESVVVPNEEITIPAAFKADILWELVKTDISEERLFSDFYGFAQINAHDRPYRYYRESADYYATLAAQAAKSDDHQGAIHWYGVAIMKDPDNPNWFTKRGNAKRQSGNSKGAIADYDRAIELDPQNVDAYHDRGVAKGQSDDPKGAIPDFDKALELNPQDATAYYNRGFAKDELGDYKGAIADYDRAIEINPQDASAYINRGITKRKSGNSKGAIADHDRAIEINPQDADAYYNRGFAKGESGEFKDAIADYDRALEINPQDSEAYNNRGVAKKRWCDKDGAEAAYNYADAIADYDKALKIDPKYALARRNRESAKKKLKNPPNPKKK